TLLPLPPRAGGAMRVPQAAPGNAPSRRARAVARSRRQPGHRRRGARCAGGGRRGVPEGGPDRPRRHAPHPLRSGPQLPRRHALTPVSVLCVLRMAEDLHDKLSPTTPPRLWVIGDVMLDRYLLGGVERISPEAPVPVLHLERTLDRVGGAANVAQNVAALGGVVALGGGVADDEPGAAVRRLLAQAGVRAAGLVVHASAPTTVKTRALAGVHQLLRIDSEQRAALSAREIDDLLERLHADLPGPDVVLVSDYDKGVVGAALVARLRARFPATPIFVDPKGRDYARYAGVSLITPNEREV